MRTRKRIAIDRRRQRGVLLVSFVLVLLTALSFIFLKGLNRQLGAAGYRHERTHAALVEAKAALIGYAVSFPDRLNRKFGPGYLPCPADDADGIARSACASSTNSLTGRFPWATLDANDVRDASGEQVWYALSEKYRNNPHLVPLNSDTPGQITVDGTSDVVAVLIAPGPPLPGQDTRASSPTLAANYLEGENATTGDDTFTATGGDTFNDQLIVLTRRELMTAVERRVLGEVAQHLQAYFDDYGAYPWLSEFVNPSTSNFKGIVGITEGHLPLHRPPAPAPGPNATTFDTPMAVTWNLTGADITPTEGDPNHDIPADCQARTDCSPGGDPEFTPGAALVIDPVVDTATCDWWDPDPRAPPEARDYLSCRATVAMSKAKDFEGVPGTLTRTYDLVMQFRDTEGGAVAPPDASSPRGRSLETTAPGTAEQITITIRQTHAANDPPGHPDSPRTDEVVIAANGGTTGSIRVAGVQYDLDELPPWFTDNKWHHQIYVAYSIADAPGSTQTCDSVSPPCLRLRVQPEGMGAPFDRTDIHGLVIAAGAELPGVPNPRPAGTTDSYFEGENDQGATPNVDYARAPFSAAFNDQVRVLEAAP